MVTDEINYLVNEIQKHQNEYYNGESTISDADFDVLWDRLTELDPNNPILHKVGKDSGSAFEKVDHLMHMNSQQKCTNAEEFREWTRKNPRDEYIVQLKCDGSSIELQYGGNGQFGKSVTRGNGLIGDDVTCNISKAKGLVKKLKDDGAYAVRGEVVLYHDDFDKYFKDKANCRNAANGIMKRKDSEDADKLSIVVYDVVRIGEPQFKTEYAKFQWLVDNGFNVVDTMFISDIEEIIKLRDEMSTSRFNNIPYDIDGLVIKCPEVDLEDQKRDRPDKQIAFKFILNEQSTVTRAVDWSVNGKTRTPVAICDPVQLCGTTVQRANICNLGLIKRLGLKIGSTVVMVKRGEIIPKIERVLFTPADAQDIQFPTVCECCGSTLVATDTELYCPNKKCPNTLIHRLVKWASINNIYGLGPAVAEDLFNSGITTVKDLYLASVDKIAEAINSKKEAEKIKKHIDNNRKVPVKRFIAGYDLDEIGETTVKNICEALKPVTLKELLEINSAQLESCTGFAEISAEKICEQFREFKDELMDLSKIIEVDMPNTNTITYDGGISHLYDQHVAFTGEFATMKRKQAEDMLEQVGGHVDNKVTPKTRFLVANAPSSTSKYVDAVKYNTAIIDESEFIKLLRGSW